MRMNFTLYASWPSEAPPIDFENAHAFLIRRLVTVAVENFDLDLKEVAGRHYSQRFSVLSVQFLGELF